MLAGFVGFVVFILLAVAIAKKPSYLVEIVMAAVFVLAVIWASGNWIAFLSALSLLPLGIVINGSEYKNYSGDANIEHGGFFFDLSEWRWGYVPALRITPIGNVAWLVEKITILIDCAKKDFISALESYGFDDGEKGLAQALYVLANSDDRPFVLTDAAKTMISEALLHYGAYNPANYGYSESTWVVIDDNWEHADSAYLCPCCDFRHDSYGDVLDSTHDAMNLRGKKVFLSGRGLGQAIDQLNLLDDYE